MKRRCMASRFAPAVLVAAVGAMLGGCMVGPDYQRPSIAMPAAWSEPPRTGASTAPGATPWWQDGGDAELDSLIERALRDNLDLQMAEHRIREARSLLQADRSALWPGVDASASAARGQQSANAPGVSPFAQGGDFGSGHALQNLFQVGFDANWELDLFGGTRRSIEAARAEAQGVVFDRDAVALSLTAEVARAYVDLRSAQAQLAIARQDASTRREAWALVHARFVGGLATDGEQATAEAGLHRAEAVPAQWEDQGTQAIHRLGVLLGMPPASLAAELSTVRPLGTAPTADHAGLPSELLRRRPDVQRAERQVAAATARIGVATADLYPKFSLAGSAGLASFTSSHFFSADSTIWALGPSMSWPIFRAGQIRATIEVRDQQAQEALLAYRQAILVALEDVENALAAHRHDQQRHDALAATLAASEQAVARAQSRYQGGLVDYRSVLGQRQQVIQDQRELELGTASLWRDWIALHKALGGSWGADTSLTSTTRPGEAY